MTAIALIGRQGVRTFGAATAGYTTANEPFELPDGAEIALTSAFVRDRAGRDYRDTIVPTSRRPTRSPPRGAGWPSSRAAGASRASPAPPRRIATMCRRARP
jgi:hypothetical protein